MIHIHFIVNPIAGKERTAITHSLLRGYFEEANYLLSVKENTQKRHAIQLTRESINDNAHIIAAFGGDGIVNEVASGLIKSCYRYEITFS